MLELMPVDGDNNRNSTIRFEYLTHEMWEVNNIPFLYSFE